MIAQLIEVLNTAAQTLPVDTRHGWAQIVAGQPAVHTGAGQWVPVAEDTSGTWSYVRMNGQARVEPIDIGEPCSGVRVRLPFRLVALLDRSACDELPGLLVQTAGSIRMAKRQFVQASGSYRVGFSSILWQVDDFATQEFQPLPNIPTDRVLVAIDVIMEVDGSEECFQGCGELTDVVCAIIAKASNDKVVECLGIERLAQICDIDCPPTTVNGTESDTPTITVLQGGNPVGTLDPVTGVVTIEECDPGCEDPFTLQINGQEFEIFNDPCGETFGLRVLVDGVQGGSPGPGEGQWSVTCPTLCGRIAEAETTAEDIANCAISSGKGDALTCDLVGRVAPEDVFTKVYDCLTEASQDALEVTVQLRDTAANNLGAPDVYPAGTNTTKTAPDGTVRTTDGGTTVGAVLSGGNFDLPQSRIKYRDQANASQVTDASDTEFASGTLRPATEVPRRELFDDSPAPLGLYVTVDDLINDTVPQVPAGGGGCTRAITATWGAYNDETTPIVLPAEYQGLTYDFVSDVGTNGTITVSVNGGTSFAAPPFTVGASAVIFKRTTFSAAGSALYEE